MVTFPSGTPYGIDPDRGTKNLSDSQQLLSQVIVPVDAARTGKWTATGWVVHTDGSLRAVDVDPGEFIERWIPGVLEGHLYEVTIVADSDESDLVITMGGLTLATALVDGTVVYECRPVDGSPLRFEYTGASTLAADVTSVTIEAKDPINISLIPEVETFTP